MCMKIPDGLEDECIKNTWLKILAPIYGLKFSDGILGKASNFFKKLKCKRSLSEPCLNFSLSTSSMLIWLSRIDDYMHDENPDEVSMLKNKFM